MPKRCCFLVLASLGLLGGIDPGRAGNSSEAESLLDRAIQARGGAESLARFRARVARGTGTIHRDGLKVRMTYECFFQDFNRARSQITFESADTKVKSVTVIDHDHGWVKKDNEPATAMPNSQLQVEREALYLSKVTSLLPLKDRAYHLSPLGAVTIRGRDAVGVKVHHAGHEDVRLYFDKETALLVKAEQEFRTAPDGEETILEMLAGQYKDVQDLREPTRITLRFGETPYAEYHHTDLRVLETLDDSLFAMP
jgi:hypothetical protein